MLFHFQPLCCIVLLRRLEVSVSPEQLLSAWRVNRWTVLLHRARSDSLQTFIGISQGFILSIALHCLHLIVVVLDGHLLLKVVASSLHQHVGQGLYWWIRSFDAVEQRDLFTLRCHIFGGRSPPIRMWSKLFGELHLALQWSSLYWRNFNLIWTCAFASWFSWLMLLLPYWQILTNQCLLHLVIPEHI